LSGGNFHGQPIALALDILAIALAELAAFGERRTYLLLDDREPRRDRLPAFLAHEPGLNSGYMIAQYTAASLVAENAVLATQAGREATDHVLVHRCRRASRVQNRRPRRRQRCARAPQARAEDLRHCGRSRPTAGDRSR